MALVFDDVCISEFLLFMVLGELLMAVCDNFAQLCLFRCQDLSLLSACLLASMHACEPAVSSPELLPVPLLLLLVSLTEPPGH